MAGVSVTIASLNKVKSALSDFQTEAGSFSDKISSSTEGILIEVRQSVKNQESLVTALEKQVASLKNEIEQIQTAIISVNARITSLKAAIENLEKQKPPLEARIPRLEEEKRQLEAQRNRSQGDTSGIDAQIRAIENQIQHCSRMLFNIKEQISSAKKQQAENERRIAELKNNKMRKESEHSAAKSALSRAKSKFERLSAAGESVEREVANLNMAARKFEQNSTPSNATSKAGVNNCISEIEEYLAINLGMSRGQNAPVNDSSYDVCVSPQEEQRFPYETRDAIPETVYNLITAYQEHGLDWNATIRSGNTTKEIKRLRKLIQQNHLSVDSHFTRRATFADMGPELQGLQLEDLVDRSYPFVGIMSACEAGQSGFGTGNVIYEISAPAGTAAFDATNLLEFREVMFDSPVCYIDSVEMCGYNTVRVNISIQ